MADPYPKGQQPAKPHGQSRLRNEYYANSTDNEIVQVPNSEPVVEETQLEHNGAFSTFDHDTDKQSDYGNDEGFDDAALLERTSVMKTTEQTPSSPKWSPLSRDAFCATQDTMSASSPHFTFGQPSHVTPRNARNNVGLQPSQVSSKSSLNVDPAHGPHAKHARRAAEVSADHLPNPEPKDLQRDDFIHPRTSHKKSKRELEPHKTSTSNQVSSPEEWSFGLLDKQPTPPSAQPPKPSQGTKRSRTAKKGKKSRTVLLAQQHGDPWPPRGNDESLASNQSAIPEGTHDTLGTAYAKPDQQQEGYGRYSAQDHTEGFPSNQEYQHEASKTNNHQFSHASAGDVLSTQDHDDITVDRVSQHPLQSETFASAADVVTSPRNSLIASAEEVPLGVLVEDTSVTLPNGDLPHVDSVGPSIPDHPERPDYIPGNLTGLPDEGVEGTSQLSMSQAKPERKVRPQYIGRQLIDETILHHVATQSDPHRVAKPHKKPRPANGVTSQRPQAPVVQSTIESHLEALRVSLLAEKFRKEHEQSTSTKRHEEVVAALYGRIESQAEQISDGKGRVEELRSMLARLTEKAKTNQKYATGLQKDYEKLQKTVTVFQAQNKKTLQDKISEIQNERDSLCGELESTLGSFATLKNNMTKTIDDLYVRLQTSESKRRDYVEILGKQNAMLRDERTKRDALEKSLVASFQGIQRQLGESTSLLTTKLDTLQSHTASATAIESQGSNIKECLLSMRALQSTPFLTTQDAQKAERMLRFMQESVDLGFKSVSVADKSNETVSVETQTFFKAQLETLKEDILKYEEVVADNRKAKEANAIVTTQLETEQQQCARLDDQLKVLQQSEGDLKGRIVQLECELRDLKNAAHEETLHPLITEQELVALREQLRQTTHGMNYAKEQTLAAEKGREEEAKKAAQLQTQYDGVVEELRRMAAAEKQKPRVDTPIPTEGPSLTSLQPQDITKIREQIVDDCLRDFREKESSYKNEVHRLTLDRDEKDQSRQKMENELSASKDQLHNLRKNHQALTMKLDGVQKEKEEAEARLKSLQREASDASANGPSLASMAEHLQQKTNELDSKTRDNALLQRQISESTNKLSELQDSLDRLQAQVSEHPAAVEAVRHEAENRLVGAQKRARSAVEAAQGDVSKLRLEKQAVVSELELSRSREQDHEKNEAELTLERDDLQRQLAEHCDARKAKDAEVLQLATNAAREKQLLVDKHRTELGSRDNSQARLETALKEAEALLRRKDDEHQAKIKYEREKAESELKKVVEQYESLLLTRGRRGSNHERTSSSLGQSETPTRPKLKLNFDPSRRKVNRQGNSALSIPNPFAGQHGHPMNAAQTEMPGPTRKKSDHFDNLFEEPPGTGISSSHAELSLVDPAAEFVPDTQDMDGPAMSMDNFLDSLNQADLHELEFEKESSTDLSPMNSDALAHLGRDIEQHSDSRYAKHGQGSGTHVKEAMNCSDNVSESGSRSSHTQERPKSQANTASRLMPPSITTPKRFPMHQSKEKNAYSAGPVRRRIDEANSPEYMLPPPSRLTRKGVNVQQHSTYAYQDEDDHNQLQEPDHGDRQKRKGLASHADSATKKSRVSPQQPAEDESSQLKKRSSFLIRLPIGGSRSKMGPEASQTSVASSAAARPQATDASSSIAPRTPNQRAPSGSNNRTRGQRLPPSSTRSTQGRVTKRHSTRSTSRTNDLFNQRFDRELP
ncbi:hypothetical protein NX059_011411 [Plenodomus lindquistii]|nr:hypothetical protein NX059_011411 [Plenodomus lindquistii]